MKCDFVFDYVYRSNYETDSSCNVSNVESCAWLKSNKTTLSLQKNDEKHFKYAITVTQNHEEIVNYPEKNQILSLSLKTMGGKELVVHQNKKNR